jgi:MFS family permease
MVTSVLPAYLVLQLGMSPMIFGAIDGLYQGIGSLVRWIGGAAADRSGRHKELAAAGYGLSAICRIALVLAGNAWGAVTAIVALDRVGKGFRTAPRDALISLSTTRADLGVAFGVHRALDALGALLGPLVAFLILYLSPRAFDQVFVISFSVALVGLATILLFVENTTARDPGAGRLLPTFTAPLADPEFRRMLIVACVLALTTVSDGFVYLLLQRRLEFDAATFPLLAAGTAVIYTALSIPAGRIADRFGRTAVFVAGHVALLVLYAMLLLPQTGRSMATVCVLLLGSYYAMTDGVLAASASGILPEPRRATGLALLGTGVSVSRLAASLVFGLAWSRLGTTAALVLFATGMTVGIAVAVAMRRRLEGSRS